MKINNNEVILGSGANNRHSVFGIRYSALGARILGDGIGMLGSDCGLRIADLWSRCAPSFELMLFYA